MKLNLDLRQLTVIEYKKKTICVRISEEDYADLKAIDDNVSQIVRGLIEQFLDQYKQENRKWTRNK